MSSLDETVALSLPLTLSIDKTTTLNNDAAQASSSTNNKQSSTSSNSKRWTWTKPEGKPKRPLSSYNLFFRNYREKLVAGLPLEAALATGNSAADEQLSRDLAHILSELANTRAHEAQLVSSGLPPPKRAHKRQHGKVSFKDMAQVVGDAWRNLDTTTRTIYDAAAAVEKKRYVAEVQRWKEEQERKKKQGSSTSVTTASKTSRVQAAEPKKKRTKKPSSFAQNTVNKKRQEDLTTTATTATIPTSTTVDAKAITNCNTIRNAKRRRLAAIRTIADQAHEQQQQDIKKKVPFGNGMSMSSALSMMSLASPKSTSPELTRAPSPMASYLAMPTSAGTSHFSTNASGSTMTNLGGLVQQLRQQMVHPQRHGALQQPPYYVPAQLPSTMATTNTNIAAAHNTSSTRDADADADAFNSAIRRLLEKTETFRQPISISTSTDNSLSLAASSTVAMDIEPEPLPEATIGLDEGRLTPPPQPHAAQVQNESAGQTATVPTTLRRSSSLLSLYDIPLNLAEEDFNDLSLIFEEGAAGPYTAATAPAVEFGAKPDARQASFQQTALLANGPGGGHGQRCQEDDMSTSLNLWGGARSA